MPHRAETLKPRAESPWDQYARLFADCVLVQCEATFAEMLEAQLNCTNVPHARGAWSRPLTTPLFVFDLPHPAVRISSAAPGREVPPPLSPLHMRSLAALNALGAGLDEHLSPSTLRRAFRRLARRYHPDRHPGSSAAEQQRLARVFVEVTEHYRVLMSALQRV